MVGGLVFTVGIFRLGAILPGIARIRFRLCIPGSFVLLIRGCSIFHDCFRNVGLIIRLWSRLFLGRGFF